MWLEGSEGSGFRIERVEGQELVRVGRGLGFRVNGFGFGVEDRARKLQGIVPRWGH